MYLKYLTKLINCNFYIALYLYFITGLKYIYLLIIGDYCVRVEEPDQRTYWSKNLSNNQPIDQPANLTNYFLHPPTFLQLYI